MKVHYVSGSRADFGLMQNCLTAINACPDLDLGIIITGQHMSSHYGNTRSEIHASGLPIVNEIPICLQGTDGAEMANALAAELSGFTAFWQEERPDIVLLLGDRGEMVAAALAAVHLGIFVAHIHGGERSGTLDESFRHVISKLAHYHFPATEDAATRLQRMGEQIDAITVIGAPGLVGLMEGIVRDSKWLIQNFSLPVDRQIALVVFHPVVQEADTAGEQIQTLVESLLSQNYAAIVFRPNSDAGGAAIDQYLNDAYLNPNLKIVTHLERKVYLKVLASSDLMIGNSSSGIIESASFNVPCINLGDRQKGRLRNNNTIDCRHISHDKICEAIVASETQPRPFINQYGDGKTDNRLVTVLKELDFNPERLKKYNAY